MMVYGYDTTIPVSMEEMLLVVGAVSRGAQRALVVADMPFLSYQPSKRDAVYNAGQFTWLDKVPNKLWGLIEKTIRKKNK